MSTGKNRLLAGHGRLAAALLLILTIVGIVALFALPARWLHQRYDTALEESSDKLQRYQRVAVQRPAIEAAIAEVEKLDARRYYLHAASPNLAAAELQSLANRLVEKHKGRVVSSRIHAQKDSAGQNEGAMRVSIDIQLSASIIPLQLILHTIETHVPYLFIEKAAITSKHGRSYRDEPGVQPEFDIQLTIAAYLQPGGAQQ